MLKWQKRRHMILDGKGIAQKGSGPKKNSLAVKSRHFFPSFYFFQIHSIKNNIYICK